MDVAVDDAGHDEFSAEVGDGAFKVLQACLVACINEFPVFHHQGRSLGIIMVRCEDFRIFEDFVCFHNELN